MDYMDFLNEFDTYNEWNALRKKEKKEEDQMWGSEDVTFEPSPFLRGIDHPDVIKFPSEFEHKDSVNDKWMDPPKTVNFGELSVPHRYVPRPEDYERVNSPSHYTSGKQEAIDIIEDAVKDAPSAIYGMLQAQVLKYLLRVWLKDNPLEDMKKASWYLDRLIKHYSDPPGDR